MFRILDDLIGLGEAGLRELWQRGTAPAPEELAGWVFRGWNTSLVAARSPVGGRAFAKGFFQDGAGVAGCNFVVRVRAGEWEIDTGHPFGFFAVTPAADWSRRRAALGVRLPEPDRAAATLLHLTGSVSHVTGLRSRAAQSGWRLSADGLYVGRAFVTSTLKLPVSCFALERWSPMPAALVGLREPRSPEERTA